MIPYIQNQDVYDDILKLCKSQLVFSAFELKSLYVLRTGNKGGLLTAPFGFLCCLSVVAKTKIRVCCT